MKRAPTGVGDSSRGLLLRDVLVGECRAGIDAVEVLGPGGAVGLFAQVVRDGHGDRVDLIEQLDELVDADTQHLPVFFFGETRDATDVTHVVAGTFPREVTGSHAVLLGLGPGGVEPGAKHEAQLALDVVVGAVRGSGDAPITDVGDDQLGALWMAPALLELDEVVVVEDDQRHPLVGESTFEHLGELAVEPVHEHVMDVHSKHIVQIHVVSILGFGSQVATKSNIISQYIKKINYFIDVCARN